jgi:hypothetical protein
MVDPERVPPLIAGGIWHRVFRLVALLAAGRGERNGSREPAEDIEEALVGGILSLLARHVPILAHSQLAPNILVPNFRAFGNLAVASFIWL